MADFELYHNDPQERTDLTPYVKPNPLTEGVADAIDLTHNRRGQYVAVINGSPAASYTAMNQVGGSKDADTDPILGDAVAIVRATTSDGSEIASEQTAGQIKAKTDNLPAEPADKSDVQVTVEGDGLTSEQADQLASVYAKVGTARIEVSSPVAQDGTLEIWRRDDYADDRSLTFTFEDYTGPTFDKIEFKTMPMGGYQKCTGEVGINVEASFEMVNGDLVVTVELASADTADLSPFPPQPKYNHVYTLRGITAAGELHTLASSALTLRKDLG